MDPRERLLTPGEVAALFRVDPKTVTRWAAAGRIHSIRTPGGHRRFPQSQGGAPLRPPSGRRPAPAPTEVLGQARPHPPPRPPPGAGPPLSTAPGLPPPPR